MKIEAANRLSKFTVTASFAQLAKRVAMLFQGTEARGTLVNQNDGDPGVIFTANGTDVIDFGIHEVGQLHALLKQNPDARIYGKIISATRFQMTVRRAAGADNENAE